MAAVHYMDRTAAVVSYIVAGTAGTADTAVTGGHIVAGGTAVAVNYIPLHILEVHHIPGVHTPRGTVLLLLIWIVLVLRAASRWLLLLVLSGLSPGSKHRFGRKYWNECVANVQRQFKFTFPCFSTAPFILSLSHI
jgi:hypothetical protein